MCLQVDLETVQGKKLEKRDLRAPGIIRHKRRLPLANLARLKLNTLIWIKPDPEERRAVAVRVDRSKATGSSKVDRDEAEQMSLRVEGVVQRDSMREDEHILAV